MKRQILYIFCFFTVILLIGCGRKPMYHITVKNIGMKTLNNVTVKFDEFNFRFGILSTGIEAGHGHVGEHYSLPEKATVTWTVGDAPKKYSKTLVVKSKVPKHYQNLDIYFNIDDKNNVTLTYKSGPFPTLP